MFTLIMMSPPLHPPPFPLHPSLRAQAVSGAGRPLQEPAGRAFAPEPAGVRRAALLRAPQPGEDAAGHGDADGAAWLELPLRRLGARRTLLQVPQRAFGGVHFCVSTCGYISCSNTLLSLRGPSVSEEKA